METTALISVISAVAAVVSAGIAVHAVKRARRAEVSARRIGEQLERARPRIEVVRTRTKLKELEVSWLRELPPIVNEGRMDAHDVHVKVVLHPDDRVRQVEDPGDFIVVSGGGDSPFIEFQMSCLPRNFIPLMPRIVTGRREIERIETWCAEETGVIAFPPEIL